MPYYNWSFCYTDHVSNFKYGFCHLSVKLLFVWYYIYILIAVFWFTLSSIFSKEKQFYSIYSELLGLKWNPFLFIGYLNTKEPLKLHPSHTAFPEVSFDHGIFDATLLLQPYCPSCVHMWDTIHSLQDEYKCFKRIKILFLIKEKASHKEDTSAAQYFMNLYKENPSIWHQEFSNWIANKSKIDYIEETRSSLNLINDISQWCTEHKLTKTPLLMIGNKPIPYEYSASDIKMHLSLLLNEIYNQKPTSGNEVEKEEIFAHL